MAAADPLQSLRNIHLPPAISAWPLAPGWYFLLIAIALGLGVALFFALRHLRGTKRLALKRLTQLQQNNDDTKLCEDLALLLRQVALARYPRQQVAGLHGDPWLRFLDETYGAEVFSQGPGKNLYTALYQGRPLENKTQLLEIIQAWIKKVA